MINSATATPAFLAAFALLFLLLANVLWFTRFAWWVKGSAIILVAGLFWMSWRAMPELLGWPAHAGMPPRFNVAGIQVIEPEKNGGSKGPSICG
jgi:ABC-type nickel/cobalt efflux system permease component RcnA